MHTHTHDTHLNASLLPTLHMRTHTRSHVLAPTGWQFKISSTAQHRPATSPNALTSLENIGSIFQLADGGPVNTEMAASGCGINCIKCLPSTQQSVACANGWSRLIPALALRVLSIEF